MVCGLHKERMSYCKGCRLLAGFDRVDRVLQGFLGCRVLGFRVLMLIGLKGCWVILSMAVLFVVM